MLLLPLAAIVFGIALLVWSADKFVIGAASFAHNMGMSTLMVGLTIVSIGTSAPEILVSVTAALMGSSGLGVGNALGSNIANIALVLGVTALIVPLSVHTQILKKEFPLLLFVTFGCLLLLLDLHLGRLDGSIMVVTLILALWVLVKTQTSSIAAGETVAEDIVATEEESLYSLSTGKAVFWLITGLILLLTSSRILVWGATEVALSLGVSDLVIGLTIVAVGTSLPELAASISGALKGHQDLAIGNVIGSNLFNLLAVMPMPGLILPYAFDITLLTRDYLIMGVLTLLLVIFCLPKKGQGLATLGRLKGGFFVSCYALYLFWLYISH